MSITKLTDDLDIIQALDDLPNDTGTPPLSAAELKAKFDEAGNTIKTYINDTLTDEVDTELSGKMAAPGSYGTAGQYLETNGDGTVTWSTPLGAGDMLASLYDTDSDGVVNAADTAAACTGNAATATTATTAGTCTGNSATASKLYTGRTIKIGNSDGTGAGTGVSFDGSANVTLKLPASITANITGNVTGSSGSCTGTAANANKVNKALTFGAKTYDGSAAKTILLSDLGTAGTSNIADSAVTTAKINDGAVTNAKVASGIAGSKITSPSLTTWGARRVYVGSSTPSSPATGDVWIVTT